MRRMRTITLLVLSAVAALTSATADAKDYWFPRVDVDVTVRPDGSFAFREARTYEFDDDFTWAFYKVDKVRTAGGVRVDITDFTIGENGRPYTVGDASRLNSEKPPGTYWVDYNYEGNSVYGKWFYRADDETRTFEISYVVHDAVTVFDDYAQLYWKFLGGDSDKGTGVVTGTIHLPSDADTSHVRAWLHAVLTSEYWMEGDTIRFRVNDLPPHQYVEMRILFPPDYVPDAVNRESGEILGRTVAEERVWVEEANARRLEAQRRMAMRALDRRRGAVMAVTVVAAAVLIWLFLFLRFGKEHRVSFEGDYFRELPSKKEPAVVGYLMSSGFVGASDMVATIMDLGRRGYLTIEEVKNEDRGLMDKLGGVPEYDYILTATPNKELMDLTSFERDLMRFIFNSDSAIGGSVSLHAFKKEAQKHSMEFHRWFERWKKRVKDRADSEEFFERRSTLAMAAGMVLGGITVALGVIIAVTTGSPTGAAAIGGGGLIIPLSTLMKRRSPAAALEYKQWRALKRYLLHFSELKEAPPQSLVLWEHFLVYAVTLGVADKVLKALEPHIPQMEAAAGRSFAAGWYAGSSARAAEGIGGSISGLAEGMSSMVAVAGSAMSTASGTGGGGTGGGGGGGGGGGAGAG